MAEEGVAFKQVAPMPFDADFVQPVAAQAAPAALRLSDVIAVAADPDAAWAAENPERALAFLFVSPRPCAAFDAVLAR